MLSSRGNLDEDIPPLPRGNDIPKLSMKSAKNPQPLTRRQSSSISNSS